MNKQWKLPAVIKEHFRFSTLSFLFIIAYVNGFSYLLGPENTIVGVIFTIMMSASMVRDLTATPFKHLLIQALVLVWMGLAAYLVTALPAPLSFLINFFTVLILLYAYTFEYSNHIYFPYILSYLFLVFITPVSAGQLPKRILGMLIGAVSIMLYQWFMGRKRVAETARGVLTEMIDDILLYISFRIKESAEAPDLSDTRHKLCRLSRTVYERRKRALCISEASFSMIAAGRGLEHLLILIHELPDEIGEEDGAFLLKIAEELKVFRSFLQQKIDTLPSLVPEELTAFEGEETSRLFYKTLIYIRDRLLHMTDPQNRVHYKKTALSLQVRLMSALDFSSVRAVYAFRTALLLSGATLLVQLLELPHGKWLLFTLASVSLPYADDVPVKIQKRVLATVIGGLIAVVIYSLIPSAGGRTAAMMLSGYLSFYFKDYRDTFACSTIGALGGAVFMDTFGFLAVGGIFVIRLCYILAGAALAYLANCMICPYDRSTATRQLWKKYKSVTELLTEVCRSGQPDPQLYYNLVIQAHLLEEKLTQNAGFEEWAELPDLLIRCREQVRRAHRTLIEERIGAPVFEPGHLS